MRIAVVVPLVSCRLCAHFDDIETLLPPGAIQSDSPVGDVLRAAILERLRAESLQYKPLPPLPKSAPNVNEVGGYLFAAS